jgi:hypothetical protein
VRDGGLPARGAAAGRCPHLNSQRLRRPHAHHRHRHGAADHRHPTP